MAGPPRPALALAALGQAVAVDASDFAIIGARLVGASFEVARARIKKMGGEGAFVWVCACLRGKGMRAWR